MALQKESKNPYYTLGRIVAYREKEGKLTGTSDLVEKILLDIQEGIPEGWRMAKKRNLKR